MSAAGITTLSMFAIGWVVLGCAAAFQFTTAFPLKLLPVTVKVKSEPLCIWLGGMIAATTGTIPGCVIWLGRLYPHPKLNIASDRTHIAFISTSMRSFPLDFSKAKSGNCQANVIFV